MNKTMRVLAVAASVIALGLGTARAQLTISVPNAASTGTTLNALAKLTGAPSTAVKASTSDTFVEGVVYAGAGTSGNALIARDGEVSCVFDGATTAGDYVQISSTDRRRLPRCRLYIAYIGANSRPGA